MQWKMQRLFKARTSFKVIFRGKVLKRIFIAALLTLGAAQSLNSLVYHRVTMKTFFYPISTIINFYDHPNNWFLHLIRIVLVLTSIVLGNKNILELFIKIRLRLLDTYILSIFTSYVWVLSLNRFLGLSKTIDFYFIFCSASSLVWFYRKRKQGLRNKSWFVLNKTESFQVFFVLLIIIPFISIPEFAWDATWYHAGLAQHYLLHNSLSNVYGITRSWAMGLPNSYTVFQSIFMHLLDYNAARYLSIFECGITVLASIRLTKALRPNYSFLSILILLGSPMFFWVSIHGLSDSIAVLCITGFISWSEIQMKDSLNRFNIVQIVVLGAIAGISLGVKYDSVIPLFFLILRWLIKNCPRLSKVSFLSLGIFIGILPTLIWEFFTTKNPFFPFLVTSQCNFGYAASSYCRP